MPETREDTNKMVVDLDVTGRTTFSTTSDKGSDSYHPEEKVLDDVDLEQQGKDLDSEVISPKTKPFVILIACCAALGGLIFGYDIAGKTLGCMEIGMHVRRERNVKWRLSFSHTSSFSILFILIRRWSYICHGRIPGALWLGMRS